MELEQVQLKSRLEEATAKWSREAAEQQRVVDKMRGEIVVAQENARALLTERDRLKLELAGCMERRQVLEELHQQLDRRTRELGQMHGEAASRARELEIELPRLRVAEQQARQECDSFRAHMVRLRQELDAVQTERSNEELRRLGIATQLSVLEKRNREAEDSVRHWAARANPEAVQEQLAGRDRQVASLLGDVRASTLERDALAERCRLLESECRNLQDSRAQAEGAISALEQQLMEAHASLRSSRAESKDEIASHFTWKLNYFRNQEVILNFFNQGLPVDLLSVMTDPAVGAEILGARRVERGGEGKVRLSSPQTLPRELSVQVRFTIFPQEFSLRIRPFDENKLERV